MSACVSMGARYHHQLNSVSRQNMPISSFDTLRSFNEAMIARRVSSLIELNEANRSRASAKWPWVWRHWVWSQYFRDWFRKNSTAFLLGLAIGRSFRKKLR